MDDTVLPQLLQLVSFRVVRVIFEMEEDAGLERFFFVDSLEFIRAILQVDEVCAFEQWKNDVVVVSSGAEAVEEYSEEVGCVGLVGAEIVYSLALTKHEPSEDTGGMGGVRWNIQV